MTTLKNYLWLKEFGVLDGIEYSIYFPHFKGLKEYNLQFKFNSGEPNGKVC